MYALFHIYFYSIIYTRYSYHATNIQIYCHFLHGCILINIMEYFSTAILIVCSRAIYYLTAPRLSVILLKEFRINYMRGLAMKNIQDELSNLKRLLKMLAAQFGTKSEFVLHDLRKDYRHTIVAIENKEITGRNIGDGGTNLGLEVLRNPPNTEGDIYNYFSQTQDGRMLRSSTLYFRDADGRVIGSLCINTDITGYLNAQQALSDLAMMPKETVVEEVYANNVNDLFDFFIEQSKKIVDKSIEEMTMEDKIEVVRYLDKKGFFLITHAGPRACDYLQISKYTLYKYLGIVRGDEDTAKMPNETDVHFDEGKIIH